MLDWIISNWAYLASIGTLLFAAAALFHVAARFDRKAESFILHLRELLLDEKRQRLQLEQQLHETYERAYASGYDNSRKETLNGERWRIVDAPGTQPERITHLDRRVITEVRSEIAAGVHELMRRLRDDLTGERVAGEIVDQLAGRNAYHIERELTARVDGLFQKYHGHLLSEMRRIVAEETRAGVERFQRDSSRGQRMAAEMMISGVAAALQAVETWLAFRDRSRSARAFEETFAERRDASDTREQAGQLVILVPPDVLSTMERRARSCWEKYHDVLRNEREFMPEEVDNATEALKRCICRELSRIRKLNEDTLPRGDLSNWWNSYCATR